MPRPDARDRLIDAAITVILRDGVLSLTLDATAAEAGVSKGGLLYHFPSKERLVAAVLDRWLGEFETAVEADVAAGESWANAYLHQAVAGANEDSKSMEAAPFLLMIAEPATRKIVQDWHLGFRARLADEIGELAAATVIAVADGLWFAQVFGLPHPEGSLREELLEQMRAIIDTAADRDTSDYAVVGGSSSHGRRNRR
jgi:AcrR family transcriptional regulator